MAHHPFVHLGRFMFLGLTTIQCFFLATYPAKYDDKAAWYFVSILYLPSTVLWLSVIWKKQNLSWLFWVWASYVFFAFVPMTVIIFIRVKNKLDSERFFGSNILIMTLCISPLLLLLLLNTATDSSKYRELVDKLSFRITLDLFDGLEMLEVVLDENEYSHEIAKDFEMAIIVFACLSFLLSPLQMVENKLEYRSRRWKIRRCIATFRIIAQVLFVNVAFLVLRLVLSLGYGKHASIFIAKNGIMIINSLLEICSLRKWCGVKSDEDW